MALPALRSSAPVSTRAGGWDPFQEFADLQEQFGQLVQSVFGPGLASAFGPLGQRTAGLAWRPLADVSETDQAYVIEVEVPGVADEDLTIEVDGGELIIRGEYKEREKAGLLRTRTRRVGQFEYRALLPRTVDPDAVTAGLAEGVLTVTAPKTETAKPRRIAITAH
jgi:HSP20 family protein